MKTAKKMEKPQEHGDPVSIQVARRFNAPAARVFDAWLDPATARKFLFATPDGTMKKVEINPRVGSSFTIVETRDGADVPHTGEYLAIDRPHRLVFTFSAMNSPPTQVIVAIEDQLGGCEIVLTHNGVWEDYADRTMQGWRTILHNLAAVLEL